MASDSSRPTSGSGGSRPPTSRFVEGSMNDRVSAVPPPQFLGPEQLKEFERQFFNQPPSPQRGIGIRRTYRSRPLSESSMPDAQAQTQEHIITHRKSTGFFGRVRDALGWNSSSRSNSAQKQDSARKHTSLQEPPQQPYQPQLQLPLPQHHLQRPDHLRPAKSHSEMHMNNIPQLPSFGGSDANRPTRDEVMQSYNQLMATGFFQSHAIQSTRHAAPGSRGNDRRSAPPSYAPPVPPMPTMPTIPGSAPCSPAKPPPRTSSIDVTSRQDSPSKRPTTPTARPRRVASGHHRGRTPAKSEEPMPELHNRDSSYSLRGRKRNRVEAVLPDDARTSVESVGMSSSSSFSQPLKRVAKKLRKMPSSKDNVMQNPGVGDGVVGLPPSKSIGGTVYLEEKTVRMRSPSPVSPDYFSRRESEQRQQQTPPRRTFSIGSRGEGNKLRKRGKSTSLRSRTGGFETWEMTASSERSSEDGSTGIYQDATATPPAGVYGDGCVSAAGPVPMRDLTPLSALSVIPDANRGIPSVPRIPDRYHYYHKPRAPKGRYYRDGDENDADNVQNVYAQSMQSEKMHRGSENMMVERENMQWQFGEAL